MTKKLYSALLTSFNADGTVNEKGTREIVRHNIDVNHVDGLYVGGLSLIHISEPTRRRRSGSLKL